MESCPDVSAVADLYEAYVYLTPDFNGNLTAADMLAVLGMIGIHGVSEQMEAMTAWRKMHRVYHPLPEVPSG